MVQRIPRGNNYGATVLEHLFSDLRRHETSCFRRKLERKKAHSLAKYVCGMHRRRHLRRGDESILGSADALADSIHAD